MNHQRSVTIAFAALLLGGCVEYPSQPTVAVMPAPNKPLEVFQGEDLGCRSYAFQQAKANNDYQYGAQYRYNVAYMQCMYSRGNQVPGSYVTNSAPPPPAYADSNPPPPAPAH
jgi:hypothetical protein